MLPKLCLGTAQFGLDYGVTNTKGKINQEEITEIIKNAYLEGIDYIDTAQGYGDAEILLGNTNILKDNFKIINKFSYTGISNCEENLIEYWDHCLLKSLKNLKISKFDTFLIHNSNDF